MAMHELTGNDLREAVFEVVSRELGPAALVRFIAENLSQPGRDYTEERRAEDDVSVEDLAARIVALRVSRGGRLVPSGCSVVVPAIPEAGGPAE
jgi:hypothetical protein